MSINQSRTLLNKTGCEFTFHVFDFLVLTNIAGAIVTSQYWQTKHKLLACLRLSSSVSLSNQSFRVLPGLLLFML